MEALRMQNELDRLQVLLLSAGSGQSVSMQEQRDHASLNSTATICQAVMHPQAAPDQLLVPKWMDGGARVLTRTDARIPWNGEFHLS